jgi:hypothetical protein
MRTGTFTSPKLIAPLQIALGMTSLLPGWAQEKRFSDRIQEGVARVP